MFGELIPCLLLTPAGETVSADEQNSLMVSGKDALTPSDSTTNLTAMIRASGGTVSDAERAAWEQEKQRLYQQLDDKVRAATPCKTPVMPLA